MSTQHREPNTTSTPTRTGWTRSIGREHWSPLIPVILLLLVYLGVGWRSPGFLTVDSLRSVLTQAAPLVFLAAGLTPVILLGGIDLSLAALTSLSGILIVDLVGTAGGGGLVLALAISAAAGALVGAIHAVAQIPSFVVTLGAFGLYTGLALQLSNATNEPLTAHQELITWANDYIAGLPAGFVVSALFAMAIWLGMRWLPSGRYTFAVGSNEAAALMSGISVIPLRIGLFALAGLSAALAAIPLIARTTYASPSLANTFLLPTIAAVVIGGTAISGGVGNVLRSVVGALIVTVIQIGLIVVGVSSILQNIVFGAVIIVAVAVTTDRSKLASIK